MGVLLAMTPLISLKYEAAPLPFVVSGTPGTTILMLYANVSMSIKMRLYQ